MRRDLDELYASIESKDAGRVEHALMECYGSGMTRDHVPALIALLGQPWHYRHEDVVSALQELRDPRAVDALFDEAHATYGYRDYDEAESLARKCTWALADIGSPAAKGKLELLARSANPLVAEFAQKRLDRWELEKHRKGHVE